MRDMYDTDIARFNLTNFCSDLKDKSQDDCRYYKNKEGVEFSSSTHHVVDNSIIRTRKYRIDCGDLDD